jgi:hypothetical protein
MDWSGWIAVIAGVVVTVIMMLRRGERDDDRRSMMVAYAAQRGYIIHVSKQSGWKAAFMPKSSDNVAATRILSQLRRFFPIDTGNHRQASNIIEVPLGSTSFLSIDFSHTITEGKNQVEHLWGISVLRVPCRFPHLLIRPRDRKDMIRQAFWLRDIQFESELFNRSYLVKSDHDKFAYDILHPEMIELIMALPAGYVQLSDNYILLAKPGLNTGRQIDDSIVMLKRLFEAIPQYVQDDHAFAPVSTTRLN